jgi:hypothetical protein
MTFEELASPSLPRFAGRVVPALKNFYESIRMPALPAALMIGVPLALAVGLFALVREHALINIDLVYYPLFVLVYAIWVFPILGFMAFSYPGDQAVPERRPKAALHLRRAGLQRAERDREPSAQLARARLSAGPIRGLGRL